MFYPMRRKKNALCVINKVISLLDVELKIIQWQLQKGEINSKIATIDNTPISWSGTVADLVEFAYGALETKRFNNGNIDTIDLINRLASLFAIEVKDCYDTFRAIRRRVGSRTLFLDEMKEKLNERMDNMDNGVFKKKKIRKK